MNREIENRTNGVFETISRNETKSNRIARFMKSGVAQPEAKESYFWK
jgi:hypothetical protein